MLRSMTHLPMAAPAAACRCEAVPPRSACACGQTGRPACRAAPAAGRAACSLPPAPPRRWTGMGGVWVRGGGAARGVGVWRGTPSRSACCSTGRAVQASADEGAQHGAAGGGAPLAGLEARSSVVQHFHTVVWRLYTHTRHAAQVGPAQSGAARLLAARSAPLSLPGAFHRACL